MPFPRLHRPLCNLILFLILAEAALFPQQTAGWRCWFNEGKIPAGWSKTSALALTPSADSIQLQGSSWDAKMWTALTLPAGEYLLSGKGSGKLNVYVLSNNPFKGGNWGKIAGLINLSGATARIEERPFRFLGGDTIIVAQIQGPADSAALHWLEITPKAAPPAEIAPVASGSPVESVITAFRKAVDAPTPSATGKPVLDLARRLAAPGVISMVPLAPPIVIDGDAADWDSVPLAGSLSTVIGQPPASESDASVTFKAAMSEDSLFLLVRVSDDALQFAKQAAPYMNDCIELFFDPLLSRAPRYDDSAMQVFVTSETDDPRDLVAKGKVAMHVKAVPMRGGWAFEASLPLSNDFFIARPGNGLPIGFNISYNDNDRGPGRLHKLTWSRQDTGDASWQRTDVFGLLVAEGETRRALTPTLPSPMVVVRRQMRSAGESFTNAALLGSLRPEPPVVRGFMSGQLQEGKAFRDMRSWGANVVRLQFGPGYTNKRDPDYWKPDHLPPFLDWLERAVSNARDAGIQVVLDCHGLPTGKAPESAAYWGDPDLEGAFCGLWKAIAARLTPYRSAIWGYDLYNEPLDRGQLPYAPREWRPLAVKIIKAIRSVDPKTWIIYEVGPGGGNRGFDDLLPLPDARVIYSAHFYEPGTFTHQGVENLMDAGLRVDASPAAVVYPGLISGREMNREELERSLSGVIAFQNKWRVPIFIGEFSVIAWAPVPSAVAWLTDVIGLFEKYHWSWAYHAFREYTGWSLEHEEGLFPGKGKSPAPATRETERAKVVKAGLARNRGAP
ncbi:MAG: cellulase family glycosylhydrolase [Spirochaetes bacterium]|nr:cellulase family glycosylhydrolase [Spirochaetota bacterium]